MRKAPRPERGESTDHYWTRLVDWVEVEVNKTLEEKESPSVVPDWIEEVREYKRLHDKWLDHPCEPEDARFEELDGKWAGVDIVGKLLDYIDNRESPSQCSGCGELKEIIEEYLRIFEGPSDYCEKNGGAFELLDKVEQRARAALTKLTHVSLTLSEESVRFRKLQEECAIMERGYWERIQELEKENVELKVTLEEISMHCDPKTTFPSKIAELAAAALRKAGK